LTRGLSWTADLGGLIYHNWQKEPNGGWNKYAPEWENDYRLDPYFGQAKEIAVGTNQDGRLEIFYEYWDGLIYHNSQYYAGNSCDWTGARYFPA
jgi:hypothetical protein